MKKLLNTIYITHPDSYLYLDGGNIGVSIDRETVTKIPLLNIESIVTFGRSGASPALIQDCLENSRELTFLSPQGRFMGRITGTVNGNVVLRKTQYRWSESDSASLLLAKLFITGKIYNQRWILERAQRDHGLVIDTEAFVEQSLQMKETLRDFDYIEDLDSLRGIEGNTASGYYSLFDQMILQQKSDFQFNGRNRRPPLDRVNALLSFAYTLLANECAAALETVGLDPYVGFIHQDRPGRRSLALDLMEELRAAYADRFVLKLINKKLLHANDFITMENGAVQLTDTARQTFLQQWQLRKQETLVHPFLNEKLAWGLVPYAQAMLLARFLRGDLDTYPPFLWK